jgi:hypothetical protein
MQEPQIPLGQSRLLRWLVDPVQAHALLPCVATLVPAQLARTHSLQSGTHWQEGCQMEEQRQCRSQMIAAHVA